MQFERVERGVVKRFAASHGYGFIAIHDERGPTGEDIFFRLEQGRLARQEDWEDAPSFGVRHGEIDPDDPMSGPIELSTPRQGNAVVFVRHANKSNGRPVAAPWAYAHHWQRCSTLVESQPPLRVVRLRDGRVVEIVWQGDSGQTGRDHLREVSIRWPRLTPYGGAGDEIASAYARFAHDIWRIKDGLVIQAYVPDPKDRRRQDKRNKIWLIDWDRRAPLSAIPNDRWGLVIRA